MAKRLVLGYTDEDEGPLRRAALGRGWEVVGPEAGPRVDDVIACNVLETGKQLAVRDIEWAPLPSYPVLGEAYFGRPIQRLRTPIVTPHATLFIKPIISKAFPAQILYPDQDFATGVPEHELWACPLVDWCSEHRFFVLRGKICASAPYSTVLSSGHAAEQHRLAQTYLDALKASVEDLPDGFVIDTGHTRRNDEAEWVPAVVECNDGLAFGCYGADPDVCLDLLHARCEQLQRAGREMHK